MNPLEIVSVVAGVLYALLAVVRRRSCWLFGALSSALLAWLSARAGLPMQAGLQVVYVAMALYGWVHWSREGADAPPDIGRWPLAWHVGALLALVGLTLVLAPIVAQHTDSAWPRIDTATTLGGLVATWLAARLKIENWLYWVVIDSFSIWLYSMQGLVLVAGMYVLYAAISVAGWFEWRKRLRLQAAT